MEASPSNAMMDASGMEPHLEIPRADFVSAFTLIRKLCKPRKEEEAVLSFDGQCFHIELGGMAVTPPARGYWPGQARVPGRFILTLAKVLPTGDPIRVKVAQGGKLQMGTSVTPCHWQAPWSKVIDMPMNPTHLDFLLLRLEYSDEDIARSGLAGVVRRVEERAHRKITCAAAQLDEFGISFDDLKSFVYEHLRQRIKKAKP